MNPGLIKLAQAQGAVGKFRIVAHGTEDGTAKQAATADDAVIGVTEGFAYVNGDRFDVVRNGMGEVTLGGPVTRGDPLVSDAEGRAVVAPAANTSRIVGFAEISGVAGDIIPLTIAPQFITLP